MKKTTGSKRRRIEEQIIVLMDDEGHFYELPRATLEASRVPEAQEDEVEEKLKDAPEKFVWIHRTTVPEVSRQLLLRVAAHFIMRDPI